MRLSGWLHTLRVGCATLLAGLMCVVQLVALAHLTLVPHATCAQHGESIHGGATAAAVLVVTATVDAAEDETADDHCGIPGHPGGHGAALLAPAANATRLVIPPVAASTAGPAVIALARLWRLAPKTSPPAVPA